MRQHCSVIGIRMRKRERERERDLEEILEEQEALNLKLLT